MPASRAHSCCCTTSSPEHRPRIDIPGTLLATGGLFSLVYGFSHASTTSWGNSLTIGMLTLAVVLLSAFVLVESRVEHPLLPLRVVLHRDRGGSYLAVAMSAIAIFAVFLFLTYYLQQNLGLSPMMAGVAFLPMVACIMFSSITANVRLVPRFGRPAARSDRDADGLRRGCCT